MAKAPNYLNPDLPTGLRIVDMPVVDATAETLQGYGQLVDDPEKCKVEIVRWPAAGWRTVDEDTGDEAGTTEGVFVSDWQGDILYGRNDAVGGHYILAYAQLPEHARTDHTHDPHRMMLWHANYHPDGGQLFFPLEARPFMVPLALPGDDITPDKFVCFRFDGRQGLYIHPNIWHEGVFSVSGTQRFFDRQGRRMHARISVDFAREFGCLVSAAIPTNSEGGGRALTPYSKGRSSACRLLQVRQPLRQGARRLHAGTGQHHIEGRHRLPLHVAQGHGHGMDADFMLLAGQAAIVYAHLLQHGAQGLGAGDGVGGEPRKSPALEPRGQIGIAHGGEQYPAGRGGVGGQTRSEMQPVGEQTRGRSRRQVETLPAVGHDDHFVGVQHHRRKRCPCLLRQAVQGGLQDARQACRGQVTARETQHPRREPEIAAIRLQVTQVGQGQQVAARCGAASGPRAAPPAWR